MFFAFIIGIVAQFAMISSAYRFDRYVPSNKIFWSTALKAKMKKFFFLFNKENREKFLLLSIVLHFIAYVLILTSTVLFIIALIANNNDLNFVCVVTSFSIAALSTLECIIEMVVMIFYEDKHIGE